jgi:enoyl-[acyl-carrier protein] reductase II
MKTRITELFGIKYPILMSGMSWISTPEMVAEVCNAGGLGILATGPLNQEMTRAAVRRVRELTDKPFGANATLLFPGAMDNAKVLLEEKVPVVNFALGKGDWICEAAHKYGGKVIATVVRDKHALAAEAQGADAVIATGHEAAAHGEAVTSLLLVPSLVDALKVPVIAAGGFGDGRGLVAALALGAEGIAMGTRFMTTKESPLHENFKKLSVQKSVYDTLFSKRFDGIDCRVIDAPGARRQLKAGLNPIQLLKALPNSSFIAKQLHMPYMKLFFGVLFSGWKTARQLAYMANGFESLNLATQEGDLERGWLTVGQVTGLVKDIPTVKELMERMVAQAEAVSGKVAGQTAK